LNAPPALCRPEQSGESSRKLLVLGRQIALNGRLNFYRAFEN